MDRSRMLGKLALVPLALFLGATTPSAADPPEPSASAAAETLTPDQAIALALAHHPALAASASELDAARADRETVRSGWLPRLELSEEWTRSTNPTFVFASKLGQEQFTENDFAVESLNRPDPFTNAATRLTLRQNVWDAGRTSRAGEAAAAGEDAASASLDRERQRIAFGAVRAFWGVVLADEMLAVARSAETAATANFELARARVDEGLAVPSDRMLAEVRVAEVKAMVSRAATAASTARAALRQALGIRDDRPFRLVPPPVGPATAPPPVDALVDEALSARGELGLLAARRRQAEAGEAIARSRYLPEFGFGAQYEWNADTPFGSDGANWTFGAGLRFSLFDGLETRSRIGRARADLSRVDALRTAVEEGIRLEVRAAAGDVASAEERLRVAQSAVGLAEEALRIVNDRYTEGLAVMVELLGAESASTNARGSLVAASHDLAVARAALDLAVGRAVPTQPVTE